MSIYNFLNKLEEQKELEFAVNNNIITKSTYNKYVVYKRYLVHRKNNNKTLSYSHTAEDLNLSERWVQKCVGYIEGKLIN